MVDVKNEQNFQTMNMIHKLTKIKKKKLMKNYKNIETFETLTNPVYTSIPTDLSMNDMSASNDSNVKESSKQDNKKKDYLLFLKPLFDNIKKMTGNTKENFTEDEYEGMDDVFHGLGITGDDPSTPTAKGKDFISRIYDYVVQFNRSIAKLICLLLTFKLPDEDYFKLPNSKQPPGGPGATSGDVDIIAKYIGWGESIFFAYYAVFNWYYLMFDIKTEETIKPIEISVQELRFSAEKTWASYMFLYFFEYAYFFPAVLNHLLLNLIPKYLQKVFNGTFLFILLFIALCFGANYWALSIKNFLVDLITFNMGNYILSMMCVVVTLLFIISIFSYPFDWFNVQKHFFLIGDLAQFYHGMGKSPFLRFIPFLITWVAIRSIFVFLLDVPFGAGMVAAYLFIYTVAGIDIYKPGKYLETRIDLIEKIKTTKSSLFDDRECENRGYLYRLFTKCMKLFSALIDVVNEQLVAFSFLILLSFAATDYFKNISGVTGLNTNIKFKDLLFWFNFVIIMFIIFFIGGTTNWIYVKSIFVNIFKNNDENKLNPNVYDKFADLNDNAFMNEDNLKREPLPNDSLLKFYWDYIHPWLTGKSGIGTIVRLILLLIFVFLYNTNSYFKKELNKVKKSETSLFQKMKQILFKK
jgi:hypothetical protein